MMLVNPKPFANGLTLIEFSTIFGIPHVTRLFAYEIIFTRFFEHPYDGFREGIIVTALTVEIVVADVP